MPIETKWTPGPWENLKTYGYTAVGSKTLIARVFSEAFRDLENEQANANLIKAAPDLYEATHGMLEAIELYGADSQQFFDARDFAIATMASARGEK